MAALFIVNKRGDIIIHREYYGNEEIRIWYDSNEVKDMLRNAENQIRADRDSAYPPLLEIGKRKYVMKLVDSILFVLVILQMEHSLSFGYCLEVLNKISEVIKDYCGNLNEESIKRNFSLVYEIFEATIDYGFPQLLDTDLLKPHIHNIPFVYSSSSNISNISSSSSSSKQSTSIESVNRYLNSFTFGFFDNFSFPYKRSNVGESSMNSKSTTTTNDPINSVIFPKDSLPSKNEIYLDVNERMTILSSLKGEIIKWDVNGEINVRNFLHGNPKVQISFSEKTENKHGREISEILKDSSYHSCVKKTEDLDLIKSIEFIPSSGQLTLLKYRISLLSRAPPLPLSISVHFSDSSKNRLDLEISIHSTIDRSITNLEVLIPIPKSISSSYLIIPFILIFKRASCEFDPSIDQSADFISENNEDPSKGNYVYWKISTLPNSGSSSLRIKIYIEEEMHLNFHQYFTFFNIHFQIPSFAVSGLHIKNLKIHEKYQVYEPLRWIRYNTFSYSYTVLF